MKVELLHHSPLWLASHAIRMSHDSHDKSDTESVEVCPYCNNSGIECVSFCEITLSDVWRCRDCEYEFCKPYEKIKLGEKDRELIYRVGNKLKHKSVLEQLVYWFEIDGISRACLQELARHRTARLVVQSTRYVLKKKLKNEKPFSWNHTEESWEDVKRRASEYIVLTGYDDIDSKSIKQLNAVIEEVQFGGSNDYIKFLLPEAFKTKLQWQIDGRNLQNFLQLRTAKDAHWEIRALAHSIYDTLPEDHKYLFKEFVHE